MHICWFLRFARLGYHCHPSPAVTFNVTPFRTSAATALTHHHQLHMHSTTAQRQQQHHLPSILSWRPRHFHDASNRFHVVLECTPATALPDHLVSNVTRLTCDGIEVSSEAIQKLRVHDMPRLTDLTFIHPTISAHNEKDMKSESGVTGLTAEAAQHMNHNRHRKQKPLRLSLICSPDCSDHQNTLDALLALAHVYGHHAQHVYLDIPSSMMNITKLINDKTCPDLETLNCHHYLFGMHQLVAILNATKLDHVICMEGVGGITDLVISRGLRCLEVHAADVIYLHSLLKQLKVHELIIHGLIHSDIFTGSLRAEQQLPSLLSSCHTLDLIPDVASGNQKLLAPYIFTIEAARSPVFVTYVMSHMETKPTCVVFDQTGMLLLTQDGLTFPDHVVSVVLHADMSLSLQPHKYSTSEATGSESEDTDDNAAAVISMRVGLVAEAHKRLSWNSPRIQHLTISAVSLPYQMWFELMRGLQGRLLGGPAVRFADVRISCDGERGHIDLQTLTGLAQAAGVYLDVRQPS